MDRLPRLRRHRQETGAPDQHTDSTTPPATGDDLELSMHSRPAPRLSHFRNFRLRSSNKRARDTTPEPQPHVQTPAVSITGDSSASATLPATPQAPSVDIPSALPTSFAPAKDRRPPRIPAFLELSEQEINFKFQELVWLERNRLLQSVLDQSPDSRWARVTGPYLKALDRYMNIQPWRNNRIRLLVPDGKVDYINASPIVMHSAFPPGASASSARRQPDRYIAMQGPKQASANHVWRMIVEQVESPGVIVMLTETHEANMEKCFQYFPRNVEDPPIEINAHDEFDDGFLATVRCEAIEETPAGHAIEMRKLVVKILSPGNKLTHETAAASTGNSRSDGENHAHYRRALEGEERVIWHFLFKEWPDFGVPSVTNLDSFFTLMRMSREKNSNPGNPRIVHCSAGVGRSGTFIALEHLIGELNAGLLENFDEQMASYVQDPGSEDGDRGGEHQATTGGCDDLIFATVNQLREQRRTMVQAESQYLFIYQVMRKLWLEKYGSSDSGSGEPAAKRLEVGPPHERGRSSSASTGAT